MRAGICTAKTAVLFLLLPLLLSSCTVHENNSYKSRYKKILHRPLVLRAPMKLYPINQQINGYDDRYLLGGGMENVPVIGIVPAGHTVQFQAAIRTRGFNTWEENIEGTLDFRGKTYPIYFYVGNDDESDAEFLKYMNDYFIIPK